MFGEPAPRGWGGLSSEPVVLWADGWLANRDRLSAVLNLSPGHDLRTIVADAYRRWGRRFPDHLEGSVAAVVWEAAEGGLLLVADRLGLSAPAWARDRAGRLWVAPSPAEILSGMPVRPPLDETSLVLHLCGAPPPAGRSVFRGVATVPAGHWVAARPGRVLPASYWRPEARPVLRLRDDEEYAEALRCCLAEVMADHAPESCGVTLTSGLDSSTVAATLRKVAPQSRVTAFSWSAPELPGSDEHPIARRVAAGLGLPVVPVRADCAWPLSRADGGPLAPLSDPFRAYFHELWDETLKMVADRGLGVLLTGAGGDELFGGEVCSYPDLLLQGRWLRLASDLRQHLPHSRLGPRGVLHRMLVRPLLLAYSPVWQERLARPVPWLAPRYHDLYRRTVTAEEPPRRMLPGRLLRLRLLRDPAAGRALRHLADLAGGHGVRLVHPLLDRRLVELAARLPSDQTFAAGRWKVVLRRAMRGALPMEVLERRRKIVPTAILERGLKERAQDRVRALMRDMRCAEMGLVDEAKLRQHYREYLDGRHAGAIFWYTLTLEDWLRHHF